MIVLIMVLFMTMGRLHFSRATITQIKSLRARSISNSPVTRMILSRSSLGNSMGAARRGSSSDINNLHDIILQPEEEELFNMFTTMIKENNLGTTVRIAGGWVRDKLLGVRGKEDIDVALDNLSGVEFAKALSEWNERKGGSGIKFGVIQQNPDKSKHLETATATLGKYQIDFVNLRTEEYTDSRIPSIEIGTPQEDADRRDLTINSLFYNVNKRQVEDFTGRGLRDLANGLARTPLEAQTTLKDDPLRALRAVRFSCRFDLTMASDLARACQDKDVLIALQNKVSRERIFVETELMLQHTTGAPRAILMLHSLGLINNVLSLDPVNTEIESELKQEYFAPPHDADDARVILPCSEESLQSTPLDNIKANYHTYGTCVALALAIYRLSRINLADEREDTDQASLRGLSYFAALTMRGSTMSCLKPMKGTRTQRGGRSKQPLNQLVLNRLKMRARDADTIEALHSAALEMVPMLRCIMAYSADGGKKLSFQGTPLEYKGLSRLELGLALKKAGSIQRHALGLAAAALMVEALAMRSECLNLSDTLLLLTKTMFRETDVFLARFGNRHDEFPQKRDLLEFLDFQVSPPATAVTIGAISDATTSLNEAIDVMGLRNVHEDPPVLNGKDIKKLFHNIPKGSAFGDIMTEQVRWRLVTPSGTPEECKEHLLKIFQDYL